MGFFIIVVASAVHIAAVSLSDAAIWRQVMMLTLFRGYI